MFDSKITQQLLDAALQAGFTAAEITLLESESFSAGNVDGKLNSYEVSRSGGLSMRGSYHGRMGSCSTQVLEEAMIDQLINDLRESAELNESPEQDEIYPGDPVYPQWEKPETDLNTYSAADKLKLLADFDRAIQDADSRIEKVRGTSISTMHATSRLENTYGLKLVTERSICAISGSAIAQNGANKVTDGDFTAAWRMADLNPDALAKRIAQSTVDRIGATTYPSGMAHVLLTPKVMISFLGTFSSVFSAVQAQQQLSRLAGKENTVIASPIVQLIDDPLLPDGFGSQTFDDEGCATRTKYLIENGVLKTLLHNRKTAKKQGIETTGSASRAGGSMQVVHSNLYLAPGQMTPEAMMAAIGNGLLITDVTGLHAGANPVTGDFSLSAQGFTIENGQRGHAVEQVTVAGNFYQLLMQIYSIGNDLTFPGRIGSPSVDVGMLSVAGAAKAE